MRMCMEVVIVGSLKFHYFKPFRQEFIFKGLKYGKTSLQVFYRGTKSALMISIKITIQVKKRMFMSGSDLREIRF